MPPSSSVERLVELMQAGDLRALDALARTYGPRLLAVARRHCQVPADAEDAVQQALISASGSMRSIREEGSPLAWLSTLVARHCSRMNRSVRAHDELGDHPCAMDDPQVRAEQRELAGVLGDALMVLSRTDRLLFLLAAEGFTSVELAGRFELSHDGVRSRLKRTRKRLRDALEHADTPRPSPGTAGVTLVVPGARPHDDDPLPSPALDR